MDESKLSCVEIQVFGLVQGVFFRASTQQRAQELGLSGWVRNRADGSVQIKAKGKDKNINELIQWCRSGGPRAARVDECSVQKLDLEDVDTNSGFRVSDAS
jgi:acylphosphatase